MTTAIETPTRPASTTSATIQRGVWLPLCRRRRWMIARLARPFLPFFPFLAMRLLAHA
jgi:hypothetical protein